MSSGDQGTGGGVAGRAGPVLSLIVAVADNGVIGNGNRLPWRLPEDMRWFRRQTTGKPVLMGRKTYESIGRPLPDRTNIVVTRDPGFRAEGCIVAPDLESGLAAAADADEVMVMGGADIYAQLLPRADRLYLTEVHANPEGDACFPPFDRSDWREQERTDHPADKDHPHAYSFVVLTRGG